MLLEESYLTARQPRRAPHHVIQAITSEGLARGPYVEARGGVGPATFRTKGTKHHHSANHTPRLQKWCWKNEWRNEWILHLWYCNED